MREANACRSWRMLAAIVCSEKTKRGVPWRRAREDRVFFGRSVESILSPPRVLRTPVSLAEGQLARGARPGSDVRERVGAGRVHDLPDDVVLRRTVAVGV